jgi:hypothetical protein
MSRWAEMFAALSRGADTIDTSDTNPVEKVAPPIVSLVSIVSGAAEREFSSNAAVDAAQPEVADTDDLEERAAIIEEGAGVPRAWAEGYAALSTMPTPTGFSPERWRRIVDATGTFIDRWATEAIRCGWSDLDIFGVDPAAPDRRFDCMGLTLLLDRCEIVNIDPAGADLVSTTGARQRYRRRPLPPDTVSLWDLARINVDQH